MDDSEGAKSSSPLETLYTRGERLWQAIDDDEFSPDVQQKAIEALTSFRLCQQLIASAHLFSKNEMIDDVPTSHIRYLLTDFYIATLLLKLSDSHKRLNHVTEAEACLNSFLDTCERQEIITSIQRREFLNDKSALSAAEQRAMKIERFKSESRMKKQLELTRFTKELRSRFKAIDDEEASEWEETARDLYLAQLRYHIQQIHELLRAIKEEREILEYKRSMERGDSEEAFDGRAPSRSSKSQEAARLDFSPEAYAQRPGLQITQIDPSGRMTRQTIKAQVFQPFHQQPTMTLQELADLELAEAREREQTQTSGSETYVKRYEQLAEEGLEDDEELVEKATYKDRAWDDWKDDNPKGIGNKGASVH